MKKLYDWPKGTSVKGSLALSAFWLEALLLTRVSIESLLLLSKRNPWFQKINDELEQCVAYTYMYMYAVVKFRVTVFENNFLQLHKE